MKCLLSVGGVSRRGVHKIGWFLMGRACKVCVLGTGGGSDEACLSVPNSMMKVRLLRV